jgi:hypothetical protein
MKTGENVNVSIKLFAPIKAFFFLLIMFFCCAVIGIPLPFIFGISNPILLITAIIILILPFVLVVHYKMRFRITGSIILNKNGISILKDNYQTIILEWNEIKNYYSSDLTPALLAKYYVLEIYRKRGGRILLHIITDQLLKSNGEIDENSVLAIFSSFIKGYNQQLEEPWNSIEFKTTLYSSKFGKLLIALPILIIIIDICYRLSHPDIGFKTSIFSFILAVTLAFKFWGINKAGSRLEQAVLKLQKKGEDLE